MNPTSRIDCERNSTRARPEGIEVFPLKLRGGLFFADHIRKPIQLIAFGRALMEKNDASNGNSNDRDNRNDDRLFSLFGHFVFSIDL